MNMLPYLIPDIPVIPFLKRLVSFFLWLCLLLTFCGLALLGGVVLAVVLKPEALLSKETLLIGIIVVATTRTAWSLSKPSSSDH